MRYLCVFLFLLVVACSNQNAEVVPSKFEEATREELRQAMRYHGILFAERDDTGEWYFLRQGKRCRLFAYADARKN